ncbi:mRNA decapping enzyme (Cop-D9R) [Mythimna separata entomopoxvirus 'L']|uniref:mRNA decapping enzyme (Cop-D9R) n=1 Tax=Mythimna separata entomopoxvirus 'L' TaxID=1293572 RepID=A0A916KQ19_9POXV|nr:mRNA decapping enzyme (Cop-D9R) [Mythimna separata entomopoxvirus 'L']CCU56279.1 mRNA decapping enzyme (Cop-D9R) [Mythimna separata entomopoxvirus 'L']
MESYTKEIVKLDVNNKEIQPHIIETLSESRDIYIKDYNTLNINNYNKKTSFNAILITKDNMVVIAERKFSYYIDTLFAISKYKNITKDILEYFIKLFDKLTYREKTIIFNKKKVNKKYNSIINFIENYFNGDIKERYLNYIHNHKPRIIFKNNLRYNRDKFLILPGGKKNPNENIDAVITRESHEEINIPIDSNKDINILEDYYSETIIYDKILSKTFIDVTIIAKIKYSSSQILNFFKPNHEISNIKFIPIGKISSMIDLFYYIQEQLICY